MKRAAILKLLLAAPWMAPAAFAGERPTGPMLPAYKQECSACHIAYPRSMLPASSWQRIMSNLTHHFGTDASIDDAQVKQLATWLSAGAAPRREPPPEDRITRSTWFVREHAEVPAAAWKRPSVKGASNCAACHSQADQGDFNERNIRIPR